MTFRISKTLALGAALTAGALLIDAQPADAAAIKAWSFGWHPGWFRTSTGRLAYGWHKTWRHKWVHVGWGAPVRYSACGAPRVISYSAPPRYSACGARITYVAPRVYSAPSAYTPAAVAPTAVAPAAYGPGYSGYYGYPGYYGGGGGGLFGGGGFLGLGL